MSEKRRKFSPQFKAEAVQMVLETGKPIAEVARDLGVHDGTLGNWVATWRRDFIAKREAGMDVALEIAEGHTILMSLKARKRTTAATKLASGSTAISGSDSLTLLRKSGAGGE